MLKQMKYLALILLIGFIGMGLFGFIGMPHQMSEHSDSDCLASFVVGSSLCPDGNNSFSYAFYHIQAYQFFSNALIGSFVAIFVAIALGFILAFVFREFDAQLVLKNQIFYLKKRLTEIADSLVSSFRIFIRWLSLLENSPSVK